MALPVGVVHFGDHILKRSGAVMAPEDGDGVEDVAQDAGLHERVDPAAGRGGVVLGEEAVDALAQRVAAASLQVIAGNEAGERAQPAG